MFIYSFSTSIERRFSLPPGCNPDNLTSKITTDNILIVNCPRYVPNPVCANVQIHKYKICTIIFFFNTVFFFILLYHLNGSNLFYYNLL